MKNTKNEKLNSREMVFYSNKINEQFEENILNKETLNSIMFSHPKTSTIKDEITSIKSDEEIIEINAAPEEKIIIIRSSKFCGEKDRTRKFVKCHPNMPYYANDMCKKCYKRAQLKKSQIHNNISGKLKKTHICPQCGGWKILGSIKCIKCYKNKTPECHPDRKHQAKNMCRQCYKKYYTDKIKSENLNS